MAEYNSVGAARSYDIQPNEIVQLDLAGDITLSVVARQDSINGAIRELYKDSPAEVADTVIVTDATITAAELAHRGALSEGLEYVENELLHEITEQELTRSLLQTLSDNGKITVPLDSDGNVDSAVEVPYAEIEKAATGLFGEEVYFAFYEQSKEQYREFYEERGGVFKAYSDRGFRSVDYLTSLSEVLENGDVNMNLFKNPDQFAPEVIAELQNTLNKAAPCLTDSRNENLDDLDCTELGAEVGRILTTAQVAMNDNEEGIVPASGMNVLGVPRINGSERAKN